MPRRVLAENVEQETDIIIIITNNYNNINISRKNKNKKKLTYKQKCIIINSQTAGILNVTPFAKKKRKVFLQYINVRFNL